MTSESGTPAGAGTKETRGLDVAASMRAHYAAGLLSGKNALVTGASRGIGRAIAVAYGSLGANVVVNYAGNETAARETLDEVLAAGGTGRIVRFDVADFTAVQETLKALDKELGGFDILVNNAGVSRDNLLVKFKEEEWDANLDTNLKGAFNCTRALAMGMMRKRAGKIINVSSVIGLIGNAGQSAYAASKAGLLGLTKSVARELASRNVQVNAIAPGYISTDMTAAHGDKLIEDVIRKIPLERLGEPVEIARMAVFLASPLSDYVTGQTFAVDGGMTMA